MYCGRDYDVAASTESEVYGIDFTNDLPSGDTISAVSWSLDNATDTVTTDPNPSNRLDGLPSIVGSIVLQRLTGLQSNVDYVLTAVVTTTLGNRISLFSRVRCLPST